MSDLTKQECLKRNGKEWVPGHERVRQWGGLKDEGKREMVQEMLDEGINLKKSMSQQDDPLVAPSTAETIQESNESVSGYCRAARDRSATQPNSYDTDTSTESGSGSSSDEEVPDWMKEYEL